MLHQHHSSATRSRQHEALAIQNFRVIPKESKSKRIRRNGIRSVSLPGAKISEPVADLEPEIANELWVVSHEYLLNDNPLIFSHPRPRKLKLISQKNEENCTGRKLAEKRSGNEEEQEKLEGSRNGGSLQILKGERNGSLCHYNAEQKLDEWGRKGASSHCASFFNSFLANATGNWECVISLLSVFIGNIINSFS
nr:hypothetical protein Iba_chr02aCG8630 [Ipomoea batatas]